MIGLFVPLNLNLLYRVIEINNERRIRFEELAATFEYEHVISESVQKPWRLQLFSAQPCVAAEFGAPVNRNRFSELLFAWLCARAAPVHRPQ